MIAQAASKLWWRRFLAHNGRSWQELEEFPNLRPDQQRRVLAEQLLSQVRYFGNREDTLPEWREAAKSRSAEELWKIWPSLPIMNKGHLISRFHPDEMRRRFNLEGIVKSTGGSTGEPTRFFHDTQMIRAGVAAMVYAHVRMGWRPGMTMIKIWGSERDIGKETSLYNRCSNRLLRTRMVEGYSLSQQTVDTVLEIINRKKPVALMGFTSMLEFVARRTLEMNASPAPDAVRTAWNGGEMLFQQQSELFRKAFGVPILNLYGGRELSAIACQFERNAPLTVFRPWLFLEIVDEHDKPVAAGESGRLLLTSTVCRGTPFLRYDIGDLGAYDGEGKGEAGITALSELHGRAAGVLELPNGKKVNCLYWNHLFKDQPEVRQFQVVLHENGSLQLLLKGEKMTPDKESQLLTTVGKFLGDLPVRIDWVERIPLTSQGKLLQVVSEK